MTPAPTPVADWWTVDQFFDRVDAAELGTGPFPLVDFGGRATGALTRHDLQRVALERRDETRLRDLVAARRVPPLLVPPGAQLTSIAAVLRYHGGVAVVVDETQHPVGIVTKADLARARTQ
jgi:CBS domain-containing protein